MQVRTRDLGTPTRDRFQSFIINPVAVSSSLERRERLLVTYIVADTLKSQLHLITSDQQLFYRSALERAARNRKATRCTLHQSTCQGNPTSLLISRVHSQLNPNRSAQPRPATCDHRRRRPLTSDSLSRPRHSFAIASSALNTHLNTPRLRALPGLHLHR